jgi:hypothetical protein
MLRKIKSLLFPETRLTYELLDRVEELEMLVDKLEQMIDKVHRLKYDSEDSSSNY